jgi:glycosyltransferase involved in cell wall biosynthesis
MLAPGVFRVALDGHVIGRRATGNETYVTTLATALAERTDVRPIVLVDRDTAWDGGPGVEIRSLRVRSRLVRIPLELPIAARRLGAHLLHVQYVAPPIARLPVVVAVHDLSFEDVPGLFPRSTEIRLRWSVRAAVRRASAIVAISEFTRGRLIDRYGLSPGRVFTTPIAVGPRWKPTDQPTQAEARDRLAIDGPFVLAVGNMHPRKNLPRLIKAVAAARTTTGRDLSLVLVGQRQWRSHEVDATLDQVGGRDWVKFTGYISTELLRALYGAASVVAYVSLYEGFGLPVVEALACGAVVVASATTAVPEAAGTAAILVDPTSDDAIAEGIVAAVTDDHLRARLTLAGPVRAEWFSMARFAESTVAAYRAAVGTG